MNRILRAGLLLVTVCVTTSCVTPIGVRPADRGDVRRLLSANAVSAELHTRTLAEMAIDGKTTGDRLFALM